MPPLVIYHASCPDGFCAAWIARNMLPAGTEFLAANYGEPPPDVTGREVYILDFSYKRPVMEQLRKQASMLTVLDHHKTAAAELEGFGKTGPNEETNVRCVFDMNKSGGRLAWEFFHRRNFAAAPGLVDYTEDRDLWRWALPGSKAVSAALASYPRTFEQWDDFGRLSPLALCERLAPEGEAILRYQAILIDNACQNAVEMELDGHKVLTTNATVLISEIGEKLCQGRAFSATYFIRSSDGKKVWSLRSREGGIDVSDVVRRHGGGGHKQAAGFEE